MSLDWKAKSSGGSLIYLVSTTSLHWRLTYAPKTVEAFVLADILKGCSDWFGERLPDLLGYLLLVRLRPSRHLRVTLGV